jgi:hypothetical protein
MMKKAFDNVRFWGKYIRKQAFLFAVDKKGEKFGEIS